MEGLVPGHYFSFRMSCSLIAWRGLAKLFPLWNTVNSGNMLELMTSKRAARHDSKQSRGSSI